MKFHEAFFASLTIRIFIVTTMPPCAQQHRERQGGRGFIGNGRGLTFSVRACARLPPHLPTSSYAYVWELLKLRRALQLVVGGGGGGGGGGTKE